MAQWYAQGKLAKDDLFIHESIIGSKFTGRVEEETTIGGKLAIRPSIEGWARIYGYNTLTIDAEDDPYAFGFQVLSREVYYISELPSQLEWRDVGIVSAVALALSFFATLYPSWRAARVNPAEALRYE